MLLFESHVATVYIRRSNSVVVLGVSSVTPDTGSEKGMIYEKRR